MFSLFKAILGGSAYATNPVGMGVTYLRQQIKREGLNSANYPDDLLKELAEFAHNYSQGMAMIPSAEKPVTYFVECLDVSVMSLCKAASGQVPEVSAPMHTILSRYGIPSSLL